MKTNELLRYCRKRMRQLFPDGRQPPIQQWTREELMREAALGQPRVLARAQASVFAEITRFVLRDMDENMRASPYVLQAWDEGTYYYYHEGDEAGTWQLTHEGAKTYVSYFEAEAYILQNFDPSDARDSILVVPLAEVEEHA